MTIGILTDFGIEDAYVGIMKGVIKSISPDVNILDINNNINPQSIPEAAYELKYSYPFFPKSTIFLNVVDPGVGTNRKAVAVKTENNYFIAPDNGLLSEVLKAEKIVDVVELNNEEYQLKSPSSTFHGRDIFSPAAAYLANYVDIKKLGSSLSPDSLLRKNFFINSSDLNYTESNKLDIIKYDRFGNIITNLIIDSDIKEFKILINETKINKISLTFADVADGELLCYSGSTSHLEIAKRNGSAIEVFKKPVNIFVSF